MLVEHVPQPDLREQLRRDSQVAWSRIAAVAGELALQPGHFDLTDENLLSTCPHGVPFPDGVIDLGDLSVSGVCPSLPPPSPRCCTTPAPSPLL
jgi:Ser/Thr protein kinase RdoA (MazF antagonist)